METNKKLEKHASKSETTETNFIKNLKEELIKNGVDEQLFDMPAINERFVEVAKEIYEDTNGAFIKDGDKRWTVTKDVQKIVASNEIFPINSDGTFDIKFTSLNSKTKLNLEIKKITEELREEDPYLSIRSFDRYGSTYDDSTFIAFATEILVDKNGYENEVKIYGKDFPSPRIEYCMDYLLGDDIYTRTEKRHKTLKALNFDYIKDSNFYALELTRKDGLIVEGNSNTKTNTYYDNGDWCLCDITLQRNSEPSKSHEMRKYYRDDYEIPNYKVPNNIDYLTFLYGKEKDYYKVLRYYEAYQLIKFINVNSKEGVEVGSVIDEFDKNNNNLVNKYPHLENICKEHRKDFINQVNENTRKLYEDLQKTKDNLSKTQDMLSKTLEFSEEVQKKGIFGNKIKQLFGKNTDNNDKKEPTK